LSEDLRRAAVAGEGEELRQAVEEALQRRAIGTTACGEQHLSEPLRPHVSIRKTPTPCGGRGLNQNNLVHQCDSTWNQVETSILIMYEKLVSLGFVYYNGKVVIVESEQERYYV